MKSRKKFIQISCDGGAATGKSTGAKLIAKNSKENLIMLKNEIELKKIVKNIAFGNKIFIAMGAGSVTNWVRNLN